MKNFYALNAGEFFVADEIGRKRRDLVLYLPLKDVGADFLAVSKTGRRARIQVKESRVYRRGAKEIAWHEVAAKKIHKADVFVFVSYVEKPKGRRLAFGKEFAVIPSRDFARLCARKKCSSGKYRFNFQHEGDRLFDMRDGKRDLSRFRQAWDLIAGA